MKRLIHAVCLACSAGLCVASAFAGGEASATNGTPHKKLFYTRRVVMHDEPVSFKLPDDRPNRELLQLPDMSLLDNVEPDKDSAVPSVQLPVMPMPRKPGDKKDKNWLIIDEENSSSPLDKMNEKTGLGWLADQIQRQEMKKEKDERQEAATRKAAPPEPPKRAVTLFDDKQKTETSGLILKPFEPAVSDQAMNTTATNDRKSDDAAQTGAGSITPDEERAIRQAVIMGRLTPDQVAGARKDPRTLPPNPSSYRDYITSLHRSMFPLPGQKPDALVTPAPQAGIAAMMGRPGEAKGSADTSLRPTAAYSPYTRMQDAYKPIDSTPVKMDWNEARSKEFKVDQRVQSMQGLERKAPKPGFMSTPWGSN